MVPHTPKPELRRRGWSPGLVAPERMHGPGPIELPDVGPSGVPYELASSRADECIEQSRNESSQEVRWNKGETTDTEGVCENLQGAGEWSIC